MDNKHIVITGEPSSGFGHYGPFSDPEVANEWAEAQDFAWGYWVIELIEVEEETTTPEVMRYDDAYWLENPDVKVALRKAADYIFQHACELMVEGRYDKPVDAIQHAWESCDEYDRREDEES